MIGVMDELRRTLTARGWRKSGGVPDVYEVWESPDGTGEVIVPLDPNRGDFESLLARAKARIA
jgi:hypothetical protein